MNRQFNEKLHHINYLTSEIDGLYHQSSLKIGLSDSASRVLYTIYDQGNSCILGDIYKQSGISKQTVNSAIRNLEKDGIIYLEQYIGKTKKVFLTEKGEQYAKGTVGRLFQAEYAAFCEWTEDEIDTYIALLKKYVKTFRRQVEEL